MAQINDKEEKLMRPHKISWLIPRMRFVCVCVFLMFLVWGTREIPLSICYYSIVVVAAAAVVLSISAHAIYYYGSVCIGYFELNGELILFMY